MASGQFGKDGQEYFLNKKQHTFKTFKSDYINKDAL